MALKTIKVTGARVHNLKNVNVTLPRDKFVVFSGLSGSGKSSLAFDTIYAEGQRRYIESLSSYARQFLGQMDKPDVDSIEGLSPAISIDQKTTSKNPRSTVGTVTEIYDYLRLLFARIGVPHCPVCGREIRQQTVDQIVDRIMTLPEKTRIQIMARVVNARKGEHVKELDRARKAGFVRARIDGNIYDLSESIFLEKNKKHTIEIVVDRLVVNPGINSRLTDSLELGLKLGEGSVIVDADTVTDDGSAGWKVTPDGHTEMFFSKNWSCPEHGFSLDELSPRMFSFNSPFGACPTCGGLSFFMKVDPDKIVPNANLTILEGAIRAPGWTILEEGTIARMYYEGLADKYGFSLKVPFREIPEQAVKALFYGTGTEKLRMKRTGAYGTGVYEREFEGIVTNLERRYKESASEWSRWEIEQYMSTSPCPTCHGARLKEDVLAVTVGGKNIDEIVNMSIRGCLAFFDGLRLSDRDALIADQVVKEIKSRLGFLCNVGLEYLTMARSAGTLSGGESQRIRLASQIGSGLTGVLYILDEPSIGLHARDNGKLIETLKRLRDLGNTVIVVEHDIATMLAADYIVDIGPGAGVHGGELVYSGSLDGIKKCRASVTGQYLSGKKTVPTPAKRRKGNGKKLTLIGARENNLKNMTVEFPLGKFICVTGVSGSGKSTLVNDILGNILANELNGAKRRPGAYDRLEGTGELDKLIIIDQSPIGRTPRSNPATYTGVFTDIRNLFAQTTDSKVRGYNAGRFSFNVAGGRCEACHGDGIVKIEMNFLSDVYIPCEVCHGARYNRETLDVRYRGKNISEVLEMTAAEAVEFFSAVPKISRKLATLCDVGLSYIKLGQSATTLSGGEAQRVKLASELNKIATGRTVYILDEPTTGLHTDDVRQLIDVLQRLTDAGNTVIVIEHDLDVIKAADWIIDLGPEGGDGGGEVVAVGTPEDVAQNERSYTGQYLKLALDWNKKHDGGEQ